MADYLDVMGDEIYFEPHRVATFDPLMWSTLRERVEGLIVGADQSDEAQIEGLEKELKEADEAHVKEIRELEKAVEDADQRTEDAEAILREIGEEAGCFATGRVLLAMQDKLRAAEQEIESLHKQLAAKPKKRK